jgi:hypothetical protein
MASTSRQWKGRENALATLNIAIEGLNLTKEVLSITPAKAVFGSVSVVLVMIRVCSAPLCDDEILTHDLSGLHG